MTKPKVEPKDVIKEFKQFLKTYKSFKIDHNLPYSIDNPYEILTSMSDKLGRICRYIKHFERNDPKSDWPEGMIEAITGLFIYTLMLPDYYDVDLFDGMEAELIKAIEQHAKNE